MKRSSPAGASQSEGRGRDGKSCAPMALALAPELFALWSQGPSAVTFHLGLTDDVAVLSSSVAARRSGVQSA
jgi:hypothetical protein